jgi:hypothetical protein
MFLVCSKAESKHQADSVNISLTTNKGVGTRANWSVTPSGTRRCKALTTLVAEFTEKFAGRFAEVSQITTFSGQSVRMKCRWLLPFGDILITRNRLLIARQGYMGRHAWHLWRRGVNE